MSAEVDVWGWESPFSPLPVPDSKIPAVNGDQRQQLREHKRTMEDFAAIEDYMRRRTGRPDRPFPVNVVAVLTRAPESWDAERIISALNGARGTPRHWDWFRGAMAEVRRDT